MNEKERLEDGKELIRTGSRCMRFSAWVKKQIEEEVEEYRADLEVNPLPEEEQLKTFTQAILENFREDMYYHDIEERTDRRWGL